MIIEGRVDGDLNQIMAVMMVRSGQIDWGYILKVKLTGFADDLNVQCEK